MPGDRKWVGARDARTPIFGAGGTFQGTDWITDPYRWYIANISLIDVGMNDALAKDPSVFRGFKLLCVAAVRRYGASRHFVVHEAVAFSDKSADASFSICTNSLSLWIDSFHKRSIDSLDMFF